MAVDSPGSWVTRLGCIPQGGWLPRVSYPRETDSPGYATLVILTRRSMQPWGDLRKHFVLWLPRVWYPGKTDSAQYDTPVSLTRWGIIPRVVMFWLIFCWIPGKSIKNPPKLDSLGYYTLASHAFYSVFRKNLIVLFIVSFESDKIEAKKFFKW